MGVGRQARDSLESHPDDFGIGPGREDEVVLEASTTAADVDGWDSVSNMEVMIALEEEFGIRFSTGEMAAVKNLGQLVERIALRAES